MFAGNFRDGLRSQLKLDSTRITYCKMTAIPGELSFGLFVGNASVVLGEFQIFEADSHRFSIRIYAS